MKKNLRIFVAALAVASVFFSGAATALTVDEFNNYYSTYNFNVVGTGNSSAGDLAQLDFDLSLFTDGTKVTLTFANNSAIKSVITQIYLDDSGEALLGSPTIVSPMVNNQLKFTIGSGSPSNMPGGNLINFNAHTALSAYANSPAPKNGIGQTESLVLSYNLLTDITSLSDALQDGTLRFGMHVTGIGTAGKSDAFIGTPNEIPDTPPLNPVPEPASLILLGMGSAFLAARKRFYA